MPTESWSLQTYGLDFAPGNQPSGTWATAGWTPTANAVQRSTGPARPLTAFTRAVADAVKVEHKSRHHRRYSGSIVDLTDDAVDMALPGDLSIEMQFRSIECGTDAALQQLCDSHAGHRERSRSRELPTSYALTIQAHLPATHWRPISASPIRRSE